MKYGMKDPCAECPFVVSNEFPLSPDRIREFMEMEFPCHQTVDYNSWDECGEDDPDGDGRDKSKETHCVGHLIISWADWGGFNMIQALTARMGEFDPEKLLTPEESGCFETWDDMIQANEDREGIHRPTFREEDETQSASPQKRSRSRSRSRGLARKHEERNPDPPHK